ncbi:hypothetical protein Salat_1871100 [Sesamum alatum]|uniref:CCHC-type domain-containing protein n=1 Tax=Sesamum alatum TaxID=300844 RepID=A0AAE2CI11_9LAMI|nr:hypothetical protein Salat_1871100 [Sesamum alatum]
MDQELANLGNMLKLTKEESEKVQRIKALVFHIENSLSTVDERSWKESDIAQSLAIKVRINLDITKPLRRVTSLCPSNWEEYVVRFTYARLPNFCYTCGKLGHIARNCDKQYDENYVDPGQNTPFGPWLRQDSGLLQNRREFKGEPNMTGNRASPFLNYPIGLRRNSDELHKWKGTDIFGSFSKSRTEGKSFVEHKSGDSNHN